MITDHPTSYAQETRAGGTIDERDALTGVRGYYTLLRDFDYDEFEGEDVYVVLCDLDNFRLFNDAYGENRCNDVLARVGQGLQECFGDRRTYRYGSDEFLIVDVFPSEKAFLGKLDKFNAILDSIDINGTPLHMTCSYGYAFGKVTNSELLHEAIRVADRKVFEAKRLGKARAVAASLESDPALSAVHHRDNSLKSYEVDDLTGLCNYIFFRGELTRRLEAQRADGNVTGDDRLALIYFNVQNFKGYNQHFGFDAGDELLLLISDAIREAFPNCLASRFSADQFMVASTAGEVDKGFKGVRDAFRRRRKDTSIWLRAGSYVPKDDDLDVGLNMDRAKMACDSIRGRRDVFYRIYDEGLKSQVLMERYVLENFDQAIAEGWIMPFYQPIARVATGDVCDVEALSRWVDPERGIISPRGFIPVLEDARLIHKLDLHIIRCVCRDYQRVVSAGGQFVMPSVNLSRLDFELCDIVEEIVCIADEYGMPHELLAVEVTESTLSGGYEFLKNDIERLRQAGFQVWLDDFGSEYSSLNLLKEYQFDLVKLDMAFLRGFETNESSRIILSHIIGMAKELGFKTLAEGVENEEQYDFLRSIGCGRAQGWYIGRPNAFDDAMSAIRAGGRSFEPHDMHEYYEDVGRMNLMRPKPSPRIDGHYASGDMPATIIEHIKGSYRYLNVTDTFRAFLSAAGVPSVEESEHRMNIGAPGYAKIRDSISHAVKTGQWESVPYEALGQNCSLLTKCIACDAEKDAYAVVMVVLLDTLLLARRTTAEEV